MLFVIVVKFITLVFAFAGLLVLISILYRLVETVINMIKKGVLNNETTTERKRGPAGFADYFHNDRMRDGN